MNVEEWASSHIATMQFIRTVVGTAKLAVAIYVVLWVF